MTEARAQPIREVRAAIEPRRLLTLRLEFAPAPS
jgi:hypothetical protein